VSQPVIVDTVAGMRALRAAAGSEPVALVPTLGALHAGHLALVERALELAPVVVVSVFVNPLQFSDPADLARYPRTLDADVAALARTGVRAVFAPGVDELYPAGGGGTRVTAGPVGGVLEGAARPGHFDGVLTVVAKLLGIVAPDVAVFGRKDAQQAFLVERMVADLDLAARIETVATVRDADGLALSSRNRFLPLEDREVALALPRALDAASRAGHDGAGAAVAAARAVLDAAGPALEPDYLVLVDPATFAPVDDAHRGAALALVAARVGSVRLIDNTRLVVGASHAAPSMDGPTGGR